MEEAQRKTFVVIVAGGTGTRLWPLSRKSRPKQFLGLLTDKTFIEKTYDRAQKVVPKEQVYIVAPENYSKYLKEYLPDFPLSNFMGEPSKKGTTAAFGYTATYLKQIDENALVHVIAADDHIQDDDRYSQMLNEAGTLASEGKVVIYGTKPRFAHTGYGYIEVDIASKSNNGAVDSYRVISFHEKPTEDVAKKYIDSGRYFWHCFGFSIGIKSLLSLIDIHDPDTGHVLKEIEADMKLPSRVENVQLASHYEKLKESNIENQILEKASLEIQMVTMEETWSDIGSWDSIYSLGTKDENGNVVIGDRSNLYDYELTDSLVHLKDKKIAVVGLENLAVVDAGDVILICPLNKSQLVKKLVDSLKEKSNNELL